MPTVGKEHLFLTSRFAHTMLWAAFNQEYLHEFRNQSQSGCLFNVWLNRHSFESFFGFDAQTLTFEDIRKLPVPAGALRVAYGTLPQQFGELRLPTTKGPHPVAVVIHGGCWYSEYDLGHLANFNASLAKMGIATWSLEYRRIGNPGGGWPGTFLDVAKGTDYLRVLARSFPVDLNQVIIIGHSAGGQLALWVAAGRRPNNQKLRFKGVLSLAGITDLKRYRPNCGDAVTKLLGGSPEQVPARYQQTSPIEVLPLKVKQRLVHGAMDTIVPVDFGRDYEREGRKSGDQVGLSIVGNAGHFELIYPESVAWPSVVEAIRSLFSGG